MRGVAWAIESTHQLTVIDRADAGGRRLLQVSRDGMVRVWDTDQRRLLVARPYAPGTRALWVAGGRALVMPPKAPPQLFDPAANTSEPLAIDPIVSAVASAAGERVVFATAGKGVKLLDVARRVVSELDAERAFDELAIAADGSWIALVDHEHGVIVVDPAGKELTRRAGPHDRVIVSGARALAAVTPDGKVVECRFAAAAGPGPGPAAAPAWTELPLRLSPPHRVMDLIYRGDELDMWATSGALLAWDGTRVFSRGPLDRIENGLHVAGGDTLIAAGGDGKLHFTSELARGALHLPSVVRRPRLASRPGSPRVMVVGDGIVVGFELASALPRALPMPPGMEARFVDEHTVLANQGINIEWQWLDLVTGAAKKFLHPPAGLPSVSEIDAAGGRVLVRELGPAQRLLLFRKGSSEVKVVAEGRIAWGRLLPGDAIVYGLGDGRLFARIEGGEPREVAKLDGVAEGAVALGYRRFAAHGSGGEIVRGDLVTDRLDRVRVALGRNGFVAGDTTGRVLVVEDHRLLVWDGAVTELAKLDQPIQALEPFDGGALVHLPTGEVQTIELHPGAVPHRLLPAGRRPAVTSHDGKLVVGLGNGGQVTVAELPSRARWTLPVLVRRRRRALRVADLALGPPGQRPPLRDLDAAAGRSGPRRVARRADQRHRRRRRRPRVAVAARRRGVTVAGAPRATTAK